jgi:hypothetical protein
MGVSVTPPAAVNLADNPKNRLYRATQSGTYSVNIPVGVYEVTRQATTNIIIGSTTIVPSTIMSLVFINQPQTSITFNSTVSSDVVPWSVSNFGVDGSAPSFMHFLNGTYFLSRTGNFQYSISTDGVSWQNRTYYSVNSEGSAQDMAYGLVSGSPRYVQAITGDGNGPAVVRSSTDLLSWGGVYSRNDQRFWGSRFGNGVFVVSGSNFAQTVGLVAVSTNGTTWSSAATYTLIGGETFTSLEFGNGLFVVGGTAGSVFTSTNGVTWTYRQGLFGGNHIRRIHYANNMFMAVGVNGTVTTSTDGITWGLKPFNETWSIANVVYNPDEQIWTITDNGTQIRYSQDNGNTWVSRSANTSITNNTFIYANGQYFYATGESTNMRVNRVAGENLVFTSPTVPFSDTYIILEYKGKTRVLS